MLLVFSLTVLLWVFGAPLGAALGISKGYDAAVALLALLLLHTFNLASWREIEKSADWGVLLLFGVALRLVPRFPLVAFCCLLRHHPTPLFLVVVRLSSKTWLLMVAGSL